MIVAAAVPRANTCDDTPYQATSSAKTAMVSAPILGRDEAWRLLAARIVDQCEAVAEWVSGDVLPESLCGATIDLYLDMAASFLAFAGAYVPGYRERASGFKSLAERAQYGVNWPIDLAFADRVSRYTGWRLEGAPGSATISLDDWRQSVEHARRLWVWEGAALAASPLSTAERIRGWISLMWRSGGQRIASWPRWIGQMRRASPGESIYSVASELLFALPPVISGEGTLSHSKIREWGRRLPVCGSVDDWRGLARQVVWNHEMFLSGGGSG